MNVLSYIDRLRCGHVYSLTAAMPLGFIGGRSLYAIEECCKKCGHETKYVQPINKELADILAVIKEEG